MQHSSSGITTDGGGGYYTNNSSEYLTSQHNLPAGFSALPYSMYNRVTRAFSNSLSKHKGGGVLHKFRKLIGGSSSSSCSSKAPSYMLPQHPTYGLRQLMTRQQQLTNNVFDFSVFH